MVFSRPSGNPRGVSFRSLLDRCGKTKTKPAADLFTALPAVGNPGMLQSKNKPKREHPHRDLSTTLRSGRDDKREGNASSGGGCQTKVFIASGGDENP
jgi:hypothetical protein